MDSIPTVIEKTSNWIKNFVIALNLCPFAAVPFKNKQIRIVAYTETSLENLLRLVNSELAFLIATDPKIVETTLIVIPNILSDFEEYLDIIGICESLLTELKLEGIIQIASFHPQYQFADTDKSDLANYTNRSPYPMIHFLREDSVYDAIQAHGNTKSIPIDNQNKLRLMEESLLKTLSSQKTKKSK